VAVTGPRQSGKTTLVRTVFSDYEYLSLEDLDVRQQAFDDPRGFLEARSADGFILDEVQHAPGLFSYLQTRVDSGGAMGRVVLTGSQNFLLLQGLSQSLAGRVGLFELWPFAMEEVRSHAKFPDKPEHWLVHGLYPALFDRDLEPADWYPRYIQTYIDRDLRSLRHIGDLAAFQRFVRLCAGRIGQLLNFTGLANDAGVNVKTAQAWISVLEASFLVFLLRPHHRNFNKRLVKQPKLYFSDTGVAASLLGIRNAGQMATHYLRGGLFENFIIAELRKSWLNQGHQAPHSFWRNHTGLEVDLIEEDGGQIRPVEIKSSATLRPEFFETLEKFCAISGIPTSAARLVYGGETPGIRKGIRILPWKAPSG